jgi:uncharacterized membrane protein YfcA
MTLAEGALVFAAGAGAGFVNSLVGGGSFISFPALVLVGVPPVTASATNTFALWPSGAAAWWAYRRELVSSKSILIAYGISSVVGAVAGAALLLSTPEKLFVRVVPWLLLLATVTFTVGPLLRRGSTRETAPTTTMSLVIGVVLQFVISIYGGYFGGGMGIMMLAAWTVLQLGNVHAMNALRSVLSAVINGAAAIAFVATRNVAWEQGLVVMVAATLAGYFGAAWLRKRNPASVRVVVVVIAWAVTGYFFWRGS